MRSRTRISRASSWKRKKTLKRSCANWKDLVVAKNCRFINAYVGRLKNSGADAILTEYPGAYHAYDAFFLKEPMKFPQGQTTRHRFLAEGDDGLRRIGIADLLNAAQTENGSSSQRVMWRR